MVGDISNTSFEYNTFFCPSGDFGYDIKESEPEVIILRHFRLAHNRGSSSPLG